MIAFAVKWSVLFLAGFAVLLIRRWNDWDNCIDGDTTDWQDHYEVRRTVADEKLADIDSRYGVTRRAHEGSTTDE